MTFLYLPSGNRSARLTAVAQILDRLRRAIDESDESRNRIAEGAGVAPSQIARLMSGERGLSIESAERLADYLALEIVMRQKRRRKVK